MIVNKELESKNTYTIQENGKVGEVQIADEVVATIAALAATEVKGVSATSGNVTNELAGKLGYKNLSKGVKVMVSPDAVAVDMALTLDYGYGIPETAKQVQEKVKMAIENMTGLQVSEVNIRIAGVNIVKE
ncbi:Asp23/Gls24 family envelope stress response protein [Anaerotaenia torta]|uniref:Asp23/Gls24 family envelope stress response protein n=1 Tax=Anaerotaenia torta TaxID=433293 RepID=UPI003D1BB7FB